jgi:hypothetical protein
MRWAEAIDYIFKPEDGNDQSHTSPSDGKWVPFCLRNKVPSLYTTYKTKLRQEREEKDRNRRICGCQFIFTWYIYVLTPPIEGCDVFCITRFVACFYIYKDVPLLWWTITELHLLPVCKSICNTFYNKKNPTEIKKQFNCHRLITAESGC